MAARAILLTVALAAWGLMGGCVDNSPGKPGGQPPVTDKAALQYLASQFSYSECAESEADTVLVFDLTIEGYMKSRRFEFPLKKEKLFDEQGNPLPSFMFTMRMECGDGISKKTGKGCGHVLSVGPRSYENGFIRMEVRVSWTSPEGKQGQIDDQVLLPVGQDSHDNFRGRWSYKASFRSPRKPATGPAPQ